jgi:hypothetical protein
MNEELKPSALSSGLVQAKNKQDDHPSFAAPGDLNNFLGDVPVFVEILEAVAAG